MELIFSDPYYDSEDWEEGKFASELSDKLSKCDLDARTEVTDIGHGADCPAVLVEIFQSIDWSTFLKVATPTGLFLLGNTINKNVDAWIEIGKKFKKVVEQLLPTRIDEHGAVLLVLHDLLEGQEPIPEVDVSVQIIDFTPVPSGKGILGKRPDALYLVTARLSQKVFVYGIKSDGRVEFRRDFGTERLEF